MTKNGADHPAPGNTLKRRVFKPLHFPFLANPLRAVFRSRCNELGTEHGATWCAIPSHNTGTYLSTACQRMSRFKRTVRGRKYRW